MLTKGGRKERFCRDLIRDRSVAGSIKSVGFSLLIRKRTGQVVLR